MIKEQIKAIIKQYADKGKKMYSEAIDSRGSRYNAGFWDGYECCANGLLRELEDMQEKPTKVNDDSDISCNCSLCSMHLTCKYYNPNKDNNVEHCIGGTPLQLIKAIRL